MSSIKKPTSSFVQLAMLLVGSTLFFAEGAHAMSSKRFQTDDNQRNSLNDTREELELLDEYGEHGRDKTLKEHRDHQENQKQYVSTFQTNKQTPGGFHQKNSEFFSGKFGSSSYGGNFERNKEAPVPLFGQNSDFPIPNSGTRVHPQEGNPGILRATPDFTSQKSLSLFDPQLIENLRRSSQQITDDKKFRYEAIETLRTANTQIRELREKVENLNFTIREQNDELRAANKHIEGLLNKIEEMTTQETEEESRITEASNLELAKLKNTLSEAQSQENLGVVQEEKKSSS